ncbi:MAG: hypothetical protein JXR95_07995 [Deltaproteobacteria bacterium]|nr:hypothetical protein [Deltaproteobacteria bacterium]
MLLAHRLVDLIEKNAHSLGLRWARAVIEHPMTPGYNKIPEEELTKRAENVYSSLGKYLGHHFSTDETKKIYMDLGRRRFFEGFSTPELVIAISLEKSVLFEAVQEVGFSSSYDLQGALELLVEVGRFFDKALVWSLMGFEEERNSGKKASGRMRPTLRWFMPGK